MSSTSRRWCAAHDSEMAGKDFCYRKLNHIRGEHAFGLTSIADRMNGVEPEPCREISVQLIS